MRISTGLRNYLLSQGSLKGAVDGSVIRIYTGTAPTTADEAVPGTAALLCEISVNGAGTGVTLDTAAAGGLITKAPGESWEGVNSAAGTAAWFRMVKPADVGDASTTATRIQGTVAVAGADLNLSSVSLANGATQTVDYFSVLMPA